MSEFLLNATNLQKSYVRADIKISVLKGLSLHLKAGESLAVTGASGVGKSTLLHCLGLLDEIDSGEFFLDDRNMMSSEEKERAKIRQEKLGFVFQFHYLMAELSAIENVMLPLLLVARTEVEARSRAKLWLEKVGLGERLTHLPSQLSGGEQQRVSIARALVREPKLILADEPTGNLDTHTAQSVFQILMDRCRELGAGLVMATHNIELACKLDRHLHLQEGVLK